MDLDLEAIVSFHVLMLRLLCFPLSTAEAKYNMVSGARVSCHDLVSKLKYCVVFSSHALDKGEGMWAP